MRKQPGSLSAMNKLNYEPLDSCRTCASENLERILGLGNQALTGMFPKADGADAARGPLDLVFCPSCKLVQLGHRYDPAQLYGPHYGYRSGLNGSMVKHLESKVHYLEQLAQLKPGDWVLDIGSNDGTTLGSYKTTGLNRVGIDPTSDKFKKFYQPGIHTIADFYSSPLYFGVPGAQPAKIITSLAMFYDLESPVEFALEVKAALAPDAIWHIEQSYLPTMLSNNSFDTICHEHVSYYSFASIEEILGRAALKVIDVGFNDINGGSFSITASHADSALTANTPVIEWVRATELATGLHSSAPLMEFSGRVKQNTGVLIDLLKRLRKADKSVLGYGASTKGNVLLQHAGIGPELMSAIAEINPDKYGCMTPGTRIPIVSDAEARAMKPDYFLVLPWHFRADILRREQEYLKAGGKFIFPLPVPEIV